MSESLEDGPSSFFIGLFILSFGAGFLATAIADTYRTHRSSSIGLYCVETDANGSRRCITPEELDAIVLRALGVSPQEPK